LGPAVPAARAGSLNTDEDVPAAGTLVAFDPDSAGLTYSLVSAANARGTVTITDPATGAYTYAPDADFSGTASFSFKANDGASDGNTATVTVTVNPVPDAPVAADGSLNTLKGAAKAGTLVASDSDSAALTYSLVDTANARGTVTITDPATGAYTYTPDAGFHGAASFTFKANDGAVDGNTATVTLVVAFGVALEDDARPVGSTVASLIDPFVTDVDPLALKGAALSVVPGSARGTWQYSLNGGRNWLPLGDFGPGRARLLRNTDKVRFVPAADSNGLAALRYLAWDRTAGVAGGVFDLTLPGSVGGAGAFSALDDLAYVLVNAANDRPVLDAGGEPGFTRVVPGDADPAGNRVGQLLGPSVTDADAGAVRGLAVTAAGSGVRTGKWQYQLLGVGAWSDIGAIPAGRALLLRPEDGIRFLPAAGFSGTVRLSYRAWDQTSGTFGNTVPVAATGTSLSLAAETASLVVTALPAPVNQAPVLDDAGAPVLAGVSEDNRASPGQTVDTFLGQSVSDADAGALRGIAVTGVSEPANGTWMYSLNGGRNWVALGGVSDRSALLLRGGDKIRFVPAAGFIGDVALTYRAWDRTRGGAGGRADLAPAGMTGGATAFSTAAETATLAVAPANDRPVLDAAPTRLLTSILPGATDPAGDAVGQFMVSAVTDPDGGASIGMAITAAVSSAKTGRWQYRTMSWLGPWVDVGTIPARRALLLGALAGIRFLPAAGFRGTVQLSYRAWDESTGVAGSKPLLAATGTSLSLAAETASLSVNAVNDRPFFTALRGPELPRVLPGDTDPAGATVDSLTAGLILDVDQGDQSGIAVTAATAGGAWEFSVDGGASWTALSALSVKNALLLAGTDRIRFVPSAGFRGRATLSYRAWDRTSGVPGDRRDVTLRTATAFSLATGTVSAVVNTAPVLTP
ncbi:MAG: cadherin-like domain-containing protein, partial [Gemmataceae bacterium]